LLAQVGGKYDASTPVKVACSDRDGKNTTLDFYPETREILEWCLDNDILLTICSRSPNKKLVEDILKAFNVLDWFLLPQVFKARKSYHFRNLAECTGLNLQEFLFFDDDSANIKVCRDIGVTSCEVNKASGLNWESLVRGLEMFQTRQKIVSIESRLTSQNLLSVQDASTIQSAESEDHDEPAVETVFVLSAPPSFAFGQRIKSPHSLSATPRVQLEQKSEPVAESVFVLGAPPSFNLGQRGLGSKSPSFAVSEASSAGHTDGHLSCDSDSSDSSMQLFIDCMAKEVSASCMVSPVVTPAHHKEEEQAAMSGGADETKKGSGTPRGTVVMV
jgi:hypothetical protein